MTLKKGPAIILVHPQMGENIGMTARAMLNCGLTDLRLVAPRDGWPSESAIATSSGAVSVIEGAKLYPTLAEAIGDCTFVVGTTARTRDMIKPVLTPELTAQAILKADSTVGKPTSAIVFGPERTGLENDAITSCDVVLNIPLNPDYMSLNIAQAVLLVAYQWYRAQSEAKTQEELSKILTLEEADLAPKENIETFLSHLSDALDETGFFATPQQRPNMLNNLRNAFQRMRMTRQEVNTFHGMVKALRGKPWTK